MQLSFPIPTVITALTLSTCTCTSTTPLTTSPEASHLDKRVVSWVCLPVPLTPPPRSIFSLQEVTTSHQRPQCHGPLPATGYPILLQYCSSVPGNYFYTGPGVYFQQQTGMVHYKIQDHLNTSAFPELGLCGATQRFCVPQYRRIWFKVEPSKDEGMDQGAVEGVSPCRTFIRSSRSDELGVSEPVEGL